MIDNSQLQQMYINLIKQLDENSPESEQRLSERLYDLMNGENADASLFIYNEGFRLGLFVGLGVPKEQN